jgi:hypothetical protein
MSLLCRFGGIIEGVEENTELSSENLSKIAHSRLAEESRCEISR